MLSISIESHFAAFRARVDAAPGRLAQGAGWGGFPGALAQALSSAGRECCPPHVVVASNNALTRLSLTPIAVPAVPDGRASNLPQVPFAYQLLLDQLVLIEGG